MFIVTEFGTPYVIDSLGESRPLNRLAVMRRGWDRCFAFDACQRFRRVPSHQPTIGAVQKILAHLSYNPITNVTTHWESAGSYDLPDIVSEVERGLQTDDDIIQQWFGADDVLRLLRSATTFEEMIDAVRCVCGEFETDSRLRALVDKVLGPAPDHGQP
jgi:hypothetical protein